MSRKWNNVGKVQIDILSLLKRMPRKESYILERFGASSNVALESLMKRSLAQNIDGVFHITGHGKAVLLPPEQYQKWRRQWGLSG